MFVGGTGVFVLVGGTGVLVFVGVGGMGVKVGVGVGTNGVLVFVGVGGTGVRVGVTVGVRVEVMVGGTGVGGTGVLVGAQKLVAVGVALGNGVEVRVGVKNTRVLVAEGWGVSVVPGCVGPTVGGMGVSEAVAVGEGVKVLDGTGVGQTDSAAVEMIEPPSGINSFTMSGRTGAMMAIGHGW